MNAHIIPLPDKGVGHYTWTGSSAIINHYTIRRGRHKVASVVLHDTLPFHSAVLNDLCTVLDRIENDPA